MSVNLTINGSGYTFPEPLDTAWGENVTSWATAVSQGMLQKAGGTFVLTAEVDFGANFGLKSTYYKTRTTNVSSTGNFRLARTDEIKWRDQANGADLSLSVNSSDKLTFNSLELLDTSLSNITGLITNAQVSNSAAIAYSKLNLSNSIVNADINSSAAIVRAKLDFGSGLTNSDIDSAAAITLSKLATVTASRVLVSDGSGVVSASSIATTTLGYLDATSSIQTQLNGKASTGSPTFSGNVTVTGDLTVNGTTTTLNTANLDVEDQNITINKGGNDASSEGAGLTVDRTGTDGSLVYQDSLASKWKAGALGSEVELVNVSGSQVITNKDVDGGTASNTSRLTVPRNTLANLLALTRKEGTIVYATDTDKFYSDDGTTLKEIGSGAGEKNFILNSDAEANTNGWTTYADAAGTRPVDGTGGTPNVTFTRSTSSPLADQASFILTKDAANRQGQGADYDFTIDAAYRAKVLSIEFDYMVNSGTFVAGTTSTDSDVIVYIYDVTNSTLIEPSSIKLFSNSSTISDKYIASFQTSSTGSTYRLIFHVASASALAYSLKIDNIKVSPSKYVYGTPVNDWQSFTSTGSWTTNSTYNGFYRRVGDSVEINTRVLLSGAPNATPLSFNIPSGLSIDTSKTTNTNSGGTAFGIGVIADAGVNGYPVSVRYNSTTSVSVFTANASGTYATENAVTNILPITLGSTDYVEVNFRVPIVGWSSSVQMSDQADTRITAARSFRATNQTGINPNASAVKAQLDSISSDTHSAFNTSLNRYVIPTSGWYRISASLILSGTNVLANNYHADIYVNGTQAAVGESVRATVSAETGLTVNDLRPLNAGDYVEIFIYGTGNNSASTLTLIGGGNFSYMTVVKESGPSAIAASEKVFAEYTTTSAQSMTAVTATRVNYNTKVYDSHNAVTTGASWVFTAPRADVYIIEAAYRPSAQAVGSQKTMSVFKNGAAYREIHYDRNSAGAIDDNAATGSTSVYLLAGETIDIRGTVSTTQNLTAGSGSNWVTVKSQ